MDSTEATQFLLDLFYDATPPVSDAWIVQAVAASPVVDANGLAPIDAGWVDTVDEWLAAAWVAERYALAGMMTPTGQVLQQVTSEGTTLQLQPGVPVDWRQVAAAFRARSPLSTPAAGVAQLVLDPGAPATIPRSWGVL